MKNPNLKELRVPICPIGKPTMNGRVYNKESFESCIGDKIPCYIGPVDMDKDNFADICGTVTVDAVDEYAVYGTVDIIDTANGRIVSELLNQPDVAFTIVPNGYGNVDENGVVSNYNLHSFGFVYGTDLYRGIIDDR